jgi:phage terminase Nu1 subunit (DNA packaging protein)
MIKDPHELQNVYKDPTYQAVIPKLKAELLKLKQQYADTDEKYPELMAVRKSHWD